MYINVYVAMHSTDKHNVFHEIDKNVNYKTLWLAKCDRRDVLALA